MAWSGIRRRGPGRHPAFCRTHFHDPGPGPGRPLPGRPHPGHQNHPRGFDQPGHRPDQREHHHPGRRRAGHAGCGPFEPRPPGRSRRPLGRPGLGRPGQCPFRPQRWGHPSPRPLGGCGLVRSRPGRHHGGTDPAARPPRPAAPPLPPAGRTPLLRGSAIMGFQTSMVVVAIGLTGQATLVNILYSTRSLWSVLVEWAAGRGRARQELPWRLAGAVCLTAAVILALPTSPNPPAPRPDRSRSPPAWDDNAESPRDPAPCP